MNKRFYLLATLFISTLTCLLSCGDDEKGGDGPKNEQSKTVTIDATAYDKWVYFNFANGSTTTQEIEPLAGTYSGSLSLLVGGEDQGMVEKIKLEVTRISKDSVDFVLKDFEFGRYDRIGDIRSGGAVHIDSLGWQLTGGEVINELPKYKVKASSKGSVAGKAIRLTTTMKLGAMPTPVTAIYTATLEKSANIDETTFNWDIALHRYDVKTNTGSALSTTAKELSEITSIPTSGYSTDMETDSMMVDMSGMMKNAVGYAPGHTNPVLNKGIIADLSSMPPTFSMSGLVYLVKLSSGEYAKIKFTGYRNDSNVTGHITFDYEYPVK